MEKQLERSGSAKDIYRVMHRGEVDHIEFRFSDRVSILDIGPVPVEFTGLGKLRCAISGCLFQAMEDSGFTTHYINHDVGTATMQVQPLDIQELDVSYGDASVGRIMAVELIDRNVVTSKMRKRVQAGDLDRAAVEKLLVGEHGLDDGARLQPAFVECTTKYQDADTYVWDRVAARLAGMSPEALGIIYDTAIREASAFLNRFFRARGFDRLDGKFEGGVLYRPNGRDKFIFGDSISPDEMRLIGPDGRSYDKDPVRQWYEENCPEWWARVKAAKAAHPTDSSKWPGYEGNVPPDEVVADVVCRYGQVAEAIGAI